MYPRLSAATWLSPGRAIVLGQLAVFAQLVFRCVFEGLALGCYVSAMRAAELPIRILPKKDDTSHSLLASSPHAPCGRDIAHGPCRQMSICSLPMGTLFFPDCFVGTFALEIVGFWGFSGHP